VQSAPYKSLTRPKAACQEQLGLLSLAQQVPNPWAVVEATAVNINDAHLD